VAYASDYTAAGHGYSGADVWWLRSPGLDLLAAYVYDVGSVSSYGSPVSDGSLGVRPAFKLNLSSVIFTSAAAGGKSPSLISPNLEPVTVPGAAEAVKLTLQSGAQTLEVTATSAQSTQSGGTLSFGYKNATAGTNQFVSCVLEQGGAVRRYGKLANSSGSSSGTLAIPMSGVADGTYTLKIFSEQDNGDNYTDFASAPVTMTVTVSGGTAIVSSFGGTIDNGNSSGGSGGGCDAGFGAFGVLAALFAVSMGRFYKKSS
jgi:hypothetical protein